MNLILPPLRLVPILFGAVVLCAGCNKPTPPDAATPAAPPTANVAAPAARFAAANTNSFAPVTALLDQGGDFYFYMSTEHFLRGLSGKLDGLRQMVVSLPGVGEEQQAVVKTAFEILGRLLRASGVEQITGLGMSSIARDNGFYRTRAVMHHYRGDDKGLIWSLTGKEGRPLEALELLPASTAMAVSSDLNLELLWDLLSNEIKAAGVTQAVEAVTQLRQMVQSKFDIELEQIIKSVPGPFMVALLLDDARTFSVPVGQNTIKIPHPGLIIMAKVKDETLYSMVEKSVPPDAPVTKTNRPGLKMQSMPLPGGLPFSPTVAQAGDYFFLSSHSRHIEELLSVKAGTTSGLKATPEFKQLSKDIDLVGNHFTFVSERLGRAITEAMQAVLQQQAGTADAQAAASAALMQKLMGQQKVTFAVGGNTPEGWVVTGNGNQHPGAVVVAPLMVAPVAVAAGLILPALSKAKDRASTISCKNNMKQILLAARMYSNDHADTFPATFVAMKDELASPKLLVCPNDAMRPQPAPTDWTLLDPADITYEFVSPGTKDDMPDRVLIRCPIHGHVGLSDGSVHERTDQ